MGMFLKNKTGNILELFGGVLAGGLSLLPSIAPFIVLLYSFRAFRMLSKTKGSLPF